MSGSRGGEANRGNQIVIVGMDQRKKRKGGGSRRCPVLITPKSLTTCVQGHPGDHRGRRGGAVSRRGQ